MYGRIDARTLRLDEGERRARLGVASDEPIEGEAECMNELLSVVSCAFCATRVGVKHASGAVFLGEERVSSAALARVLNGCSEAYLMTVTLGFGAERAQVACVDTYRAFLLDALADCLVEAVADEACSRLECKERLTNRFSPGYADLDLSVGRYIVGTTGADKLLGVRFTDSGLMTPRKTVSAIIGIRGEGKWKRI